MNTKLIIPTIVLSSALLLTGCNSGKNDNPNPNPSSSSATTEQTDQPTGGNVGYVAPPAELDDKYKGYFMAPMSDTEAWSYYKSVGAKTHKEDSSVRSTTVTDWDAARSGDDHSSFDKFYGEVVSDVEQSALNISSYLENNPSATVDDIQNNKDLVINRYSNLGQTVVEKDSTKGFYFVIFKITDKDGAGYGILVPQKGLTPEFDAIPGESPIPEADPVLPPVEETPPAG